MADISESERYWASLMGQATVILASVSEAELQVQLFDVLREFFGDSNCWYEFIPFTVIPDCLDYPLAPYSGRILRLSGVFDQNNVPQNAVMPEIGKVHFLYPYTNTQPMVAAVVKTVTDPLCCFPPGIPEWTLPVHGNGILHGLLGTMMMMPGQAWSNQQMGAFYQGKFRNAIAKARVATMRANTVGGQAWAFPQQFRVTGQRGGVSTYNVNPTPLQLR
ncbi:MAG TPA: hypothetical protein VF077_05445 [Nitrospiraceae bacterium]